MAEKVITSGSKKFYRIGDRCHYYKTFYSLELQIFVISGCPWQAFKT
jgi:hypothetical protein